MTDCPARIALLAALLVGGCHSQATRDRIAAAENGTGNLEAGADPLNADQPAGRKDAQPQ